MLEYGDASYEIVVEEFDEPPPEGVADPEFIRDRYDPHGASRPTRSLAIRSFTIRDTATGEQVFDSKRELAGLLATLAPDLLDGSASDGHDRRCVTLGRVNGRLYANIRLEPLGGTAVLDLTNPLNPEFVDYHDERAKAR
jgi:hypothetical protein